MSTVLSLIIVIVRADFTSAMATSVLVFLMGSSSLPPSPSSSGSLPLAWTFTDVTTSTFPSMFIELSTFFSTSSSIPLGWTSLVSCGSVWSLVAVPLDWSFLVSSGPVWMILVAPLDWSVLVSSVSVCSLAAVPFKVGEE